MAARNTDKRPVTDDERQFIREHWNDMLPSDIASHLGRHVATVRSSAIRMGLDVHGEHHEVMNQLLHDDRSKRMLIMNSYPRDEAYRERMRKAAKRNWKRSTFAQLSGLTAPNHYKPALLPKRLRWVLWRLKQRHGYIVSSRSMVVYYDSETRRSPVEHIYVERYGFDFRPQE